MSDKSTPPEETPASHGVKMEESHYHLIRIITATKKWRMKDFFAQAYENFLEKRKELLEAGKKEEWMRYYQPTPAKGKWITINVTEADLDPLQQAADEDNVKLVHAAWSAVYEALREMKDDVDLSGLISD